MISDFLESLDSDPFDAVIVPTGEAHKKEVAALLERIADYHHQTTAARKEKAAAMIGRALAEMVGEFWSGSKSFESFLEAEELRERKNMLDAEDEYSIERGA